MTIVASCLKSYSGFFTLFGKVVNLYPTEREEALSSISKDEIERYFYLLGKDGEEAASKYLDFLTDPEKGILLDLGYRTKF